MMATIPFDPPQLITARRTPGFVDIPDAGEEKPPPPCAAWDDEQSTPKDNSSNNNNEGTEMSKRSSEAGPGLLRRSKTMDGNILVLEPDGEPAQAFWLQRKIGISSSGGGHMSGTSCVRLAYKLEPDPNFENAASTVWQIAKNAEAGERLRIVAIKMMHTSILDQQADSSELHNPLDELSALRLIAKYNNTKDAHIIGSDLVASCSQYVYAVVPHHPDGTLLQFCQSAGSLDEPVARFFFQQILKGIKTLQGAGLCHRNLSLDSIELNGDHADITRLEWCLRYNKNAPKNEDSPLPILGGATPQYVAPEYFGFTNGVWDGYAADLWAVGLMLYSMVVGSDALFTAPIPEDRVFLDLCVRGKVGHLAERYGKQTGTELSLSEDLVDLLQKMLKKDPKERLTLDEILEHPWVTNAEISLPSKWLEAQKQKNDVQPRLPRLSDNLSVSIRETGEVNGTADGGGTHGGNASDSS